MLLGSDFDYFDFFMYFFVVPPLLLIAANLVGLGIGIWFIVSKDAELSHRAVGGLITGFSAANLITFGLAFLFLLLNEWVPCVICGGYSIVASIVVWGPLYLIGYFLD
jgi:hypothetical protein